MCNLLQGREARKNSNLCQPAKSKYGSSINRNASGFCKTSSPAVISAVLENTIKGPLPDQWVINKTLIFVSLPISCSQICSANIMLTNLPCPCHRTWEVKQHLMASAFVFKGITLSGNIMLTIHHKFALSLSKHLGYTVVQHYLMASTIRFQGHHSFSDCFNALTGFDIILREVHLYQTVFTNRLSRTYSKHCKGGNNCFLLFAKQAHFPISLLQKCFCSNL